MNEVEENNFYYEEIAKRFRQFLKAKKLSQREMAEKMGMSQQTISAYGRTGKIPIHVLIAIKSLFSLDIDWLLGKKISPSFQSGEKFTGGIYLNNNAPASSKDAEISSNNQNDLDGNTYLTLDKKNADSNASPEAQLSTLEKTFNMLSPMAKKELIDYGNSLKENNKNYEGKVFNIEGTRLINFHELGMIEIPFYGKVSAGNPIPAQQDWDGERIAVPSSILPNANSENYFCLQAVGDSMLNCGIRPGDYVVFLKSEILEQGKIAAIRVENEVSIKRIFFKNGEVEMRSCNPAYNNVRVGREKYFKIEGVMVGLYRSRW